MKKLKPKLYEEILAHRDCRKSIFEANINFINNVGQRYELMKSILLLNKKKELRKEITEIAAGQYIISLISCWETFFRDIILFVTDSDKETNKKVEEFLIAKKIDITKQKLKGISIGEYFCKQFNFQNINDTCKAINFILDTNYNDITDILSSNFFENAIFMSPNIIVDWIQEKENIAKNAKVILVKTFNERHSITHDANYRFEVDSEFMKKCEDLFIVLPQVFSLLIAQRYKQKMILIKTKQNTIRISVKRDIGESYLILSQEGFDANYTLL